MVIKHYGGGSSDTIVDCTNDYDFYKDKHSGKVNDELTKCADACEEFLTDFKDVCFNILKEEHDYLTSEDAIIQFTGE
jgi:hypothetical protein